MYPHRCHADAFEAIARTLPLRNVSYENKIDEEGPRLIWLNRSVVDRLRSLRGAGERLQRCDPAAGVGSVV